MKHYSVKGNVTVPCCDLHTNVKTNVLNEIFEEVCNIIFFCKQKAHLVILLVISSKYFTFLISWRATLKKRNLFLKIDWINNWIHICIIYRCKLRLSLCISFQNYCVNELFPNKLQFELKSCTSKNWKHWGQFTSKTLP